MPCSSQISRRPSHELPRRDDEAALALHRLDDDRRDRLGRDLRHERALERGERVAASMPRYSFGNGTR